jgi:hypothetical protein
MVMGCVYFEVRGGLNVYYEDEPRLERVNIMVVVMVMMMMMMTTTTTMMMTTIMPMG